MNLKKQISTKLGRFGSQSSAVAPAEDWLLRAAFCRKRAWWADMQKQLNIMWGYLRRHLHTAFPILERYAPENAQRVLYEAEGHWLGLQKHIQMNSFHICGETIKWMACAAVNAQDSGRESCQSPSVNTRWEVWDSEGKKKKKRKDL